MGRRGRNKRGTPYSKGDIREQYCINNKEVQVLESGSTSALFGCLSKHHDGTCHSRHSFLSVCMGRVPSDENLQELSRQPLPRRPVDDLERAYLRRRPTSICGVDPTRYAWIPEDEEPLKLEHSRSISGCRDLVQDGMRRGHAMSLSSEHLATSCPAHYLPPPPPPPSGAPRTKHVSFARSHTLTSFDDAMMELRRRPPAIFESQERLILSTQPMRRPGIVYPIYTSGSVDYPVIESRLVKKAPMKTQATQTGCLGREPPMYLSLSPRTVHRVKMVSQGAQTNGQLWNGRRLMKSYSEAGYHFGADPQEPEKNKDHDALTRTQSEEPRSPYMKQVSLPWPPVEQAGMLGKPEERKKSHSSRMYKEIFIDFEPVECEKRSRQSYTHSDGEYLSEQSMDIDMVDLADMVDDPVVDRVDGVKVSLSSYSTLEEEDLPRDMDVMEKRYGLQRTQDSVDEEFHENLVYGGIFKKQSASEQSLDAGKIEVNGSEESSPERKEEKVQMSTLAVSLRTSPFASSDSLATDQRADHSDGIWNESQSTVLQAESDNGETTARTPSKKQLLLLQHQQRSSIDTEVLEDDIPHSPMKPDATVPFVTIAAVHHYDTSSLATYPVERKPHIMYPGSSLSPALRETRRRSVKSPEKEDEFPARSDSGKITDISETSTTDDYATALDNSGTDTSSKRSARPQHYGSKPGSKQGSKEGSSFDSACSLARDDTLQMVPSSPLPEVPIAEEVSDVHEEKTVAEVKPQPHAEEKEDVSASLDSSSSGSYSVDSGQREAKTEWTDQERHRIKKGFKLDLSDHSNEPETWSEGEARVEEPQGTQPRHPKTKTAAAPIRRTQQGQTKKWAGKTGGEITPGMVRSPAMPEGFRTEDWAPPQRSTPSHTPEEADPSSSRISSTNPQQDRTCPQILTAKNGVDMSSDESSCEHKITGLDDTMNGHSPRRQRRRGGGRGRRGQGAEGGVVSRRRPLAPVTGNQQQLSPSSNKYCRSPGHSPRGSPRKGTKGTKPEHRKNADSPEIAGHLKALSAESLRSVSPGSDSVFYNEGEPHLLCHQCGREVDPADEAVEDIVQPPAGFADSPENTRSKAHARLYKKQEKRFRSEERTGERRKHTRLRTDGLRAKSEERGKEKTARTKLRPHARSTDASLEMLRGADSSPSFSEPLADDEPRVYAESYKKGSWICIVEAESTWNRSLDTDDDMAGETSKKEVCDSTSSEKEFRRKYQAATHRMVHRKSSIEMYRRLQGKCFGEIGKADGLREKLEDVLKLMLILWCSQTKALVALGAECDKKVVVRRKSGEFGFRIHGSRPVVVSAIEPDTPAESSGLEVGDIVLSVNGVSVLDASHSDVVKLAHAGSDTLDLEVARTCEALTPAARDGVTVLCTGYLHKHGIDGRRQQRWFMLKSDNCLYYYKSQAESQPLGALMLLNYKFNLTTATGVEHSFILEKHGAKSLELSADTTEALHRWKTHLEAAMEAESSCQNLWLERSCQLLHQPASTVSQPDCFGHLTQLEDRWRRRYCVLKDAALLLYADSNAARALAIACLQGYRVQSTGTSSKRFSFEVIPPESKQKHFYFYTDTEMDKKRWIAAIEYSIDRWMRVG